MFPINKVRLQIESECQGLQTVRLLLGPAVIFFRRTRAEFTVEETFDFLDRLKQASPEQAQGMAAAFVKDAEAKQKRSQ
jgi:hypothetical protein